MSTYDEIWKFIRIHNIETENIIIKCRICNRILIDAQRSTCGCKFCRACVGSYMKGNNNLCPGGSKECNSVSLNSYTNIIQDNSSNIIISKLIINCPSNNCPFTNQLNVVCNHMSVCDFRLVDCPFTEMGCKASITMETMPNHLLQEINYHSKLVIEWTMNMKNEILSMLITCKSETFPKIIQSLEESVINKMSSIHTNQATYNKNEIESILSVVEILKGKYNELTQQLNEVKESNGQLMALLKDINNQQKRENDFLRAENNEQKKTIFKLKNLLNVKINNLEDKAKSDSTKSMKNPIPKSMNKSQSNENIPVKKSAFLSWDINGLWQQRTLCAQKTSKYFYSTDQEYKMCLWLYFGGCGENTGTHISIAFLIREGPLKDPSIWPFQGCVKISIKNKYAKNSIREFSKVCKLTQKKNFDLFHFSNNDLERSGVLDRDEFAIECSVDIVTYT